MVRSLLLVGVAIASPALGAPLDLKPLELLSDPQQAAPDCLRDTGTLLPASTDVRCRTNNGRVYEQSDLYGSGAATLGDALSHLDPALVIVNRR